MAIKELITCIFICTISFQIAESRYVKRQYQEQVQQQGQQPDRYVGQESQGQQVYPEDSQNQLQQQSLDDDAGLVQLAVQEAESNPSIVTQDLNDQELQQFGQDLEKYEQELAKESEQQGHKGQITKQDVENVQEQNVQRPWYIRLKKWAVSKLSDLTDKIVTLK